MCASATRRPEQEAVHTIGRDMLTDERRASEDGPRLGTRRGTHPPESGACAVCEELHARKQAFLGATRERAQFVVACEAIVDDLGFCGHHGLELLLRSDGRRAVVRVLANATDCILDLLDDERRYAERLQDIFFAADRACPGCKFQAQQVARHVHRLFAADAFRAALPLCFPHYRDVTYAAQSSVLPGLAERQLRLLQAVVSEIGSITDDAENANEDAHEVPVASEPLRRALRVVAGVVASDDDEAHPQNSSGPLRDDSRAADDAAACPVCAGIREAEQRWLAMVRKVAWLGRDPWTVSPTCATHIRRCAGVGDERVAVMAARFAASVQAQALRRASRRSHGTTADAKRRAKACFSGAKARRTSSASSAR